MAEVTHALERAPPRPISPTSLVIDHYLSFDRSVSLLSFSRFSLLLAAAAGPGDSRPWLDAKRLVLINRQMKTFSILLFASHQSQLVVSSDNGYPADNRIIFRTDNPDNFSRIKRIKRIIVWTYFYKSKSTKGLAKCKKV